MIKGPIQEESVTFANTITVENFNTPLTSVGISLRPKTTRKHQPGNDMLDHKKLTDIYKIYYPKATEYTFFSRHTEHFPKQTLCHATKRVLVTLRVMK